MPQEIQPILLIVGGSLLSLYALWQLVKRGLLLWVGMLLIGAFLVQTSLQNPKLEIQEMFSDFDSKDLKNASLQNVQKLCEGLEELQ